MIDLIIAIALAVIVAVVVGALAILLGRVLKTIPAPIAVTVGGWFEQFGWAIGLLAGLWWLLTGGKLPR